MLVGDIDRRAARRQLGREVQPDPAGLDDLLTRLGLLREAGPELIPLQAFRDRHPDPDFGGIETARL